jgi:hypothetical protein
MNILELSNFVSEIENIGGDGELWTGIALRDIPAICGLVWHNPTFPTRNTFLGVFSNWRGLDLGGIECLRTWLQNCARMVFLKPNVMETNTTRESKHFNLVYKGRYQLYPEFRYPNTNFVVGKYTVGATNDNTWKESPYYHLKVQKLI